MTKLQFTTRSLLRTITIIAVVVAIVSGFARWQLGKIRRQEARRILHSHAGLTAHASAQYSLRTKGEGEWSRIGQALFNYIEYIDWSINTFTRKDRQSKGEAVPPVDDEAIQILSNFRELKQLNLRGAQITDVGLRSLSRLRDLEQLDISGTKVTAAGLDSFRKNKPSCEIINDPDWQSERSPLCLNYWLRKEIAASIPTD